MLLLPALASLTMLTAAHGAFRPDSIMTPTLTQIDDVTTRELCDRYTTDKRSLSQFYSVGLGDKQMSRMREFYSEWIKLADSTNFDPLKSDQRVDWILLRNDAAYELKKLERRRKRFEEVKDALPFAVTIAQMEERRWDVTPIDPETTAGQVDELDKVVKQTKRRLELGLDPNAKPKEGESPLRLTKEQAQRAWKLGSDIRSTLEKWYEHYDGFKPLFSWWVRKPYETLSKDLTDYLKFLKERVAGLKDQDDDPLIGDHIGAEAIAEDLDHELIDATPDDLIKIAEHELAWCQREGQKAATELGKKDWAEALAYVKTLHVPPGDQDNLVAQQARDAIKFVDDHNLVTIEPLCRETWRVDMLNEKGQRTLPFAAYGGQRMLVSFPLDSMDHATKEMSLRGNNIHFTRIVTPHELIPGHHLQGYMAQRYATHRRDFNTPFLVEGWALHWEMLLWDLNYQRNAEDRIGMLFWRMHRAARIIVSLKFHLGQMKPQEMIDFLVNTVGHERWTATSEVRRFIGDDYSPLYQCAYMIGGLQLRALYRELTAKGWTPKRFHDAVLHQSSIPIAAISAVLTDSKPPKGWKPKLVVGLS